MLIFERTCDDFNISSQDKVVSTNL